jgi:hypothetical protein
VHALTSGKPIVCVCVCVKGVAGVEVNILEFNSRADAESKSSYTHGSNS